MENLAMQNLAVVIGWILAIFIASVELVLFILLISGKIDLSRLISEPSGDASMSRFQLLVFTFVIAMCLFLIVAFNQAFPPDIPPAVVGLLGVSGGSYVISKGIQVNRDVKMKGDAPPAPPPDSQQ